jgi:hypothetical protein
MRILLALGLAIALVGGGIAYYYNYNSGPRPGQEMMLSTTTIYTDDNDEFTINLGSKVRILGRSTDHTDCTKVLVLEDVSEDRRPFGSLKGRTGRVPTTHLH